MIKIEIKDGIKWIVISNPARKNAITTFDAKMISKEIFSSISDPNIDIVVISGEGDFFCSGLDLVASKEDLSREDIQDIFEWHVEEFVSIIRACVESPKLVIGRINGPAVGFGAEMVYWFDYKIAIKNAYFYEVFSKRGLIPDGCGIPFLGETIGISQASSILSFGEKIEAKKALELGIINEVAENEKELDEKTNQIIEKIRKSPSGAISKIKRLIIDSVFHNLENHIRRLRVLQAKQVLSEEFVEGITSFFQKKEPSYKKIKF